MAKIWPQAMLLTIIVYFPFTNDKSNILKLARDVNPDELKAEMTIEDDYSNKIHSILLSTSQYQY